MIKRTLGLLCGLAFLAWASPALAQSVNLPANTIYGRLGISAGPGQAIPLTSLVAQFSTVLGGVSVANPGTGVLEVLYPIQTVAAASKTFATADLFKLTERSNSGSAMSDTFPAASSVGIANGTPISYSNVDVTATATITAGAGTTINGGATDTVSPGRTVRYIYNGNTTNWVRAFNSGSSLLAANNLSDVASVATARTNLGLGTMATQNLSGANFIANSNLVQAGAATFKMNATSGTANSTDTKVSALTDITTPHTTLDFIPIENHTTGTIQKTNAAELVAAIGGGVTSVTAGTGLAASPNPIVGTGTITAPIVMPQGRLTLQSGAPVMTTSQSAKGTVFYDCDQGGTVPYFDGSKDTFDTISGCEVSAAMVSAASAGQVVNANVYDMWWVHGGANRICVAMSAPSGGGGGWSADSTSDATHTGNTHTSTTIDNLSTNVVKFGWQPGMTIAGSGIPGATTIVSIGSDGLSVVISAATTTTLTGTTLTVTGGTNALRGFSYTQIDRVTRPYATNRNSITNCFNGATNYGPVSANQGTYLGTFFATANGQTSFVFGSNATGGGQAASLYLWNAYNRRDVKTSVATNALQFIVADGLVHSYNDDAGTRLNFVIGLAEDGIDVAYFNEICSTATHYPIMAIGVALDRSGNTTFDKVTLVYINGAASVSSGDSCAGLSLNFTYPPQSGAHFVQALVNQDGQSVVWAGRYLGGIRQSFDGHFKM